MLTNNTILHLTNTIACALPPHLKQLEKLPKVLFFCGKKKLEKITKKKYIYKNSKTVNEESTSSRKPIQQMSSEKLTK